MSSLQPELITLQQQVAPVYGDEDCKNKEWRIPGRCDIHGDITKFRSMHPHRRSKEGFVRRHIYIKRYGNEPKCSCFK
jgi:hypothetical protein